MSLFARFGPALDVCALQGGPGRVRAGLFFVYVRFLNYVGSALDGLFQRVSGDLARQVDGLKSVLAVHSLVQVAQIDDLSARFLLQTVCIDSADHLRRGVLALLVRSQALDCCSIR